MTKRRQSQRRRISANAKNGYANGVLSKEDFAAALRAHQAVVDAMKSPQREAVADYES